ncbi:hypothetical protein PAHAL_3G230200 [Panicum hallii]|uniref:Uncharacterized protein n=1 Tax=Panicum hallii TaxID=206008 RepID=A0A2T8KJ66_9POAL|nr:hypothetical protein PAHAL_3G230200 [Panicum hallii]
MVREQKPPNSGKNWIVPLLPSVHLHPTPLPPPPVRSRRRPSPPPQHAPPPGFSSSASPRSPIKRKAVDRTSPKRSVGRREGT